MTVLHANLLRKLSPADRASLGKVESLLPEELDARAEAKDEKMLQKSIRQYLSLHEIFFINPDMRKRSPLPIGTPDFLFVYRSVPVAIEAKTATGKLRPEQAELHPKLTANGWTVLVVRSLAQVQQLFRDIDALIDP